jgi:23S rRNA pseudouridine1911/1915/1917 synthase
MRDARHIAHTVRSDEAGTRLDMLVGSLEGVVSRSAAQRLISEGMVLVNGSAASKRHSVRPGERIEVEIPPYDRGYLEPEDIPLDVRFEDEYLIVLSKQAGLVVHPAQGHWSGTLVHALLAHADELGSLAGEDRPGIVHRLDKDTTGLMLVAKTDEAQVALSDAIKIRSVDRRYLALVHGYMAPDTGLVDVPLARDTRDRMRMSASESTSAKQAVTTFRVLERFSAGTHDDGFTLVECKLYTGRTHQIRAHMAYIKHPVVGDQLYGLRKPRADLGLGRQFLHSYRLCFEHPFSGAEMEFIDPLPEDLGSVLASIEDRSMGQTDAGREVAATLAGRERP